MARAMVMFWVIFTAVVMCCGKAGHEAEMPAGGEYTNSIGMKFVRIERGSFEMGQVERLPWQLLPVFRGRGMFDLLYEGDFDERPVHRVRISKPFYMGVYEVTNCQFELFKPEHRKVRGKGGYSAEDDEAVVNVNWYETQAFCRWLSDQEGICHRLATEAEWEYACRAGTTSNFHTGQMLGEEFRKDGGKESLVVGRTLPNAWGLYDMHGNVEEWCYDWYGPYAGGEQRDPVGYIDGEFRVLRGGSHGTEDYYLRSANRMGALAERRNTYTGFRVVVGELPDTAPLAMPGAPVYQRNVVQRSRSEISRGPDPDKPYFRGPYKYVKIATDAMGPVYASHNHDPAIVECPNGDLISMWYTCVDEGARELAQAASRLRWGQAEWEEASPFWCVPDRNDHAPAMWFDGKDTIYHYTGVGACGGRGRMAVVMRSSKDSGARWSKGRLILPQFSGGHQLSEPVFRMQDGTIVLVVDGRDTLWMSRDEQLTWYNPGGDILGIHAGVTQLRDGSIFALSRGGDIDGRMPISISKDRGKTFEYKASEFPPVSGGQRLVLLRLREGPLFFASFADNGIGIVDSSGKKRRVYGLFAAVSEDEGSTWPYKRLVSDDGPGRTIECTDGGAIMLSAHSSEYRGYLSVCQSLDGLIHLISSRNHYAFNLRWLKSTPPAAPAPPREVSHVVETFSGPDFDAQRWVVYKGFVGGFNGKGQYTVDAKIHYNGLNRVVGAGSFEATFAVENIRYNPTWNVSEGVTLGFKDAFKRGSPTMFVHVKSDRITGTEGRNFKHVSLSSPPTSAKVRFIWNEPKRQWRVFYGVNGEEPVHEFEGSKAGFYVKSALSESTAANFLMSNGKMDIDHFEIKPTGP